jgi:hypothetical protein
MTWHDWIGRVGREADTELPDRDPTACADDARRFPRSVSALGHPCPPSQIFRSFETWTTGGRDHQRLNQGVDRKTMKSAGGVKTRPALSTNPIRHSETPGIDIILVGGSDASSAWRPPTQNSAPRIEEEAPPPRTEQVLMRPFTEQKRPLQVLPPDGTPRPDDSRDRCRCREVPVIQQISQSPPGWPVCCVGTNLATRWMVKTPCRVRV